MHDDDRQMQRRVQLCPCCLLTYDSSGVGRLKTARAKVLGALQDSLRLLGRHGWRPAQMRHARRACMKHGMNGHSAFQVQQ